MNKLLLTLLLSAATAHAATIVLSENFDELSPQLNVTAVGGLTAIGGTNVDIAGNSNGWGFLCGGPESGNCVDLDGTGGNPQGILASGMILLTPGNDYYLSFDLIGSGRLASGAPSTGNNGVTTSTTVSFGSYSNTFVLASGDQTSGVVSNQLVTVATPTSTQLLFTSNTAGQTGAVLDNIIITETSVSGSGSQGSSVTPEPSTFILLSSAACLALLFRPRRSLSGH